MCALLLCLLYSLYLATVTQSVEPSGCGDGIVRGVNIGGWLVSEPWITPRFYEEVNVGNNTGKIVDEYTMAEYMVREEYNSKMVSHWQNYITKEDFKTLYAAGISHFRVPIAYWYWEVEDGEPFNKPNSNHSDPNSPLFYLKRALTWMDELRMHAVLDLHTGPGSQNGYDNSGRRGEIHWIDKEYPWNRINVDRTVRILGMISETVRSWVDEGIISLETLYGIGTLNEPHVCGSISGGSFFGACAVDFFPKAYDEIRKYFGPNETKVVIDHANQPYSWFYSVLQEPEYSGVNLDYHNYQCFDCLWTCEEPTSDSCWSHHLEASCLNKNAVSNSPLETYVGEFSLAVTDCQKYVQGGYADPYIPRCNVPETCQYYNSSPDTYSAEYKQFLTNFFLAQIDGFEAGAGWFFWTMKTEQNCAPEWDYLWLLQNNIAPQSLCSREQYCS